MRYASVYGAGLVEVERYKEAMLPLDQAIKIAANTPSVAYPSIAVYAKIDALTGLRQYDKALALANQAFDRLKGTEYDGHKVQVLMARGTLYRKENDNPSAAMDFQRAVQIAQSIHAYRNAADAGGLLAQTYESLQNLPAALEAIDNAIKANTHISDELYLAPRNLGIKAEILEKMGRSAEADSLYKEAMALIDTLLKHAQNINIQRQLLAAMSDVYSGYFASLCQQKRYDEALTTLERIRGRVETDALQHHGHETVHVPTPEEEENTRLNLTLINTDDPAVRAQITNTIYTNELSLGTSSLAQQTIAHPVRLAALQRRLGPQTLLIEYVLGNPQSYAFAITRDSVTPFSLPSKAVIEADAARYRKEVRGQKEDRELAKKLYEELLSPIVGYRKERDLVIIPDGVLHLLPFAALRDQDGYVLSSHTVTVSPSSTVFSLLDARVQENGPVAMPYIGVAAWTQTADTRNAIVRAITGPERSQLVPLPDSRKEVESIASDLPKPSTILLGTDATESRFKKLSSESTDVIHLALHGYVDVDYPDRSALVFAPESSNSGEDGLLQVREIRNLHLNARLVTLSACDTGVGPVGQAGVANLVNAFIQAGADTVVSTLWEVENDHLGGHPGGCRKERL